jgi:hypothetical protein
MVLFITTAVRTSNPSFDITQCEYNNENLHSQYCKEMMEIDDLLRRGASTNNSVYTPALIWDRQVDRFWDKYIHSDLWLK